MDDDQDAQAAAFALRAEELAAAWNVRYGINPLTGPTDAQLNGMLAEHGYPALATLPDGPRGKSRQFFGLPPDFEPTTDEERHGWQRLNASHLLGHQMLEHPEPRCGGCEDW